MDLDDFSPHILPYLVVQKERAIEPQNSVKNRHN